MVCGEGREVLQPDTEVETYQVKYHGLGLEIEVHTQTARRGEILICAYLWTMTFTFTVKCSEANRLHGHLTRAITEAENG